MDLYRLPTFSLTDVLKQLSYLAEMRSFEPPPRSPQGPRLGRLLQIHVRVCAREAEGADAGHANGTRRGIPVNDTVWDGTGKVGKVDVWVQLLQVQVWRHLLVLHHLHQLSEACYAGCTL